MIIISRQEVKTNSNLKPKQKKKTKKKVVQEIQEGNEQVIPKGSYSMDFSKFDDPNFDPFKSNKTLSNEDASETSLPQHASYAVDFDDPNFDPFKSKKSVMNSSAKDKASIDEIADTRHEEGTEHVFTVKPTNRSETECPKTDLKVDNEQQLASSINESNSQDVETNTNSKRKLKKKTKKKVVQEIQEENEEVIPKGSYSMDFSKFDDPNFDPFKSNKTLSNEDASETGLPQHASYAVDFDDPNFDPFKSKQSVMNSPTKDKASFDKIADTQHEKDTEHVTPVEPTNKSETECPKTDLKVDDKQQPASNVNESKSQDVETNTNPNRKLKKKTKKKVVQEIQEGNEEVIPKGSYSMDFSKFDDPNFDPFKSNKALSNEGASETSLPQHASYAVDFDDPNFDPFLSKNSVMNSPTKEVENISFRMADDEQKILQQLDLKTDPSNNEIDTGEVKEQVNKTSKAQGKSKLAKSKLKKKVLKKKVSKIDGDAVSKSAYSVDFSKFDDPDFDPFKRQSALGDDEIDVKQPKSEPGSYVMDFDKFDNPNFDPFKSSKSLKNDENLLQKELFEIAVGEAKSSTPVAEKASSETNSTFFCENKELENVAVNTDQTFVIQKLKKSPELSDHTFIISKEIVPIENLKPTSMEAQQSEFIFPSEQTKVGWLYKVNVGSLSVFEKAFLIVGDVSAFRSNLMLIALSN